MNKIEALNDIVTGLGGTGGYKYEIQALNAWAVLVGAAGGYKYEIQALNAIDKAKGGTGLHKYNIDALNSICKAAGGSGVNKYEIAALVFIGSNVNQNYSDEAKALFLRMATQPVSAHKLLIDGLIKELKNSANWESTNLWDRSDNIQIFSGAVSEANAFLNWKANTFTPTKQGYPIIFGRGIKTGSKSNFVDLHFNPYSQAVNFKKTDGAVSIFTSIGNYQSGYDFGSFIGKAFLGYSANAINPNAYGGIGNTIQNLGTNNQKRGLTVITRTGTTVSHYRNKVKFTDATVTDQGFPNCNVYLGGYNTNTGVETAPGRNKYGAIIFSSALTQNEVNKLDDLLTAYINATSHFSHSGKVCVCDGNSLTSGKGAVAGTSDYPTQMALDSTWAMKNLGVTAQRTVTMTTNAPENVDTDYFDNGGEKNIVVAWEIINDLLAVTNDQAIANFWTYCDARRSKGFKVVICTLIAHPTLQSRIDYCNPILRANWNLHADGIVDLAADVRLQTCTDTTYFHTDFTHLNPTGYAVVAGLVKPVVLAI